MRRRWMFAIVAMIAAIVLAPVVLLLHGWILSERPMASDGGVVGSTWFVATGPNGEEVPIEAMGLGIG
ncbi:MAG: hypothetical protein IT341_04205, partial [Chloroflexi bacterium]|nr:hypothetical protein [Chloroflexota bacterium]